MASILRVKDYDEALSTVNDAESGSSAGICTTFLKHADRFEAHAQTGMGSDSLPREWTDFGEPFGSTNPLIHRSREQGPHVAECYTVVNTVLTRP